MSLKFGIYLVEQRIISPEQFCGLVKIQQEATMSMATIAIRKNFMTIKQVAQVLDLAEAHPDKSFVTIARQEDLIDNADADQMLHIKEMSSPSIRQLVVECGLLTQRQAAVLYLHFEKHGANGSQQSKAARQPKPEFVQPEATESAPAEAGPRPPKFQQHPVVARQASKIQP